MRVQIDVDKLPIVNGPGATRLLEVAIVLMDDLRLPNITANFTPNTKITFTIKVAGSDATTSLTVKITLLSRKLSMNSAYYYFEGIAARGIEVRGWYCLQNKTGDIEEID